jgi:glycosyltransferase involved in cell wall biosynthesis
MIWMKGVGDFAEAARILARQRDDIRLCLVGEPDPGNPNTVPRETLVAWHEEGLLDWWGHCPDMPAVLSAVHAVCLPSYYGEGVPKCLLEAAAAGKPVVTTDMPGCRAAVAPDESALLVPPRHPEALAAAIARLADDPAQAARLGRAGRALAEACFGVDAVIDRHLAIYAEVAPPTSPRAREAPI